MLLHTISNFQLAYSIPCKQMEHMIVSLFQFSKTYIPSPRQSFRFENDMGSLQIYHKHLYVY
ncbi:hypothetical protein Hanom_Chr15g01344701 [Helianthus anomalus]